MMTLDNDFRKGLRALVLERAAQRSAIKIAAEAKAFEINARITETMIEALRKQMDLPPCPPVCKDVE